MLTKKNFFISLETLKTSYASNALGRERKNKMIFKK